MSVKYYALLSLTFLNLKLCKTFSDMPLFASNVLVYIQALAFNTLYQFHLKKGFEKKNSQFANHKRNLYVHF